MCELFKIFTIVLQRMLVLSHEVYCSCDMMSGSTTSVPSEDSDQPVHLAQSDQSLC